MNRWELKELRRKRKISRHYSEEDLDQGIAYAARGY
jgi:predicted HTH domain antitoxin